MEILPVLLKNMQTSGGDIRPNETALSGGKEVKTMNMAAIILQTSPNSSLRV